MYRCLFTAHRSCNVCELLFCYCMAKLVCTFADASDSYLHTELVSLTSAASTEYHCCQMQFLADKQQPGCRCSQ
jgi:hypothetical protein